MITTVSWLYSHCIPILSYYIQMIFQLVPFYQPLIPMISHGYSHDTPRKKKVVDHYPDTLIFSLVDGWLFPKKYGKISWVLTHPHIIFLNPHGSMAQYGSQSPHGQVIPCCSSSKQGSGCGLPCVWASLRTSRDFLGSGCVPPHCGR